MNNNIVQAQDFQSVLLQIQQTRSHVFAKANSALIELYWHVGKTICQRVQSAAWGKGIVTELAQFIAKLERQIDAATFERQALGSAKLSPVARELYPTIDQNFKDSYVLEFLGLPEVHSERDLQRALVRQMRQCVLELGKDFIFIREEYRLQVGNQDFFIDLLFFHRGLSALVAFELKRGAFKPEHLGQLEFYLEALDRDVKKPHENPSIGVLLCRDRDNEVVEYALSRSLSPALIAEYNLQLPDKKLLEAKLHELSVDTETNNEQ